MNRFNTALLGLLALLSAVLSSAQEPQTQSAARVNYGRPYESPTRGAFIALPPGAVEPAGWLRDWCLAARNGFTGHMDEYDPEFQRAWAADHKMTGQRLGWPQGGWPYEGGGYWFDGLARLGYILHDDALIQLAKKRLDVVIDHMHPDSILFLWWLNQTNADDVQGSGVDGGWPLWASGLFGRALAAYYTGSRDPRVLQALEMAYGNEPNRIRMGGAMSNVWPAFDTYTWTGNQHIAAGLTALFSADGGGLEPGGSVLQPLSPAAQSDAGRRDERSRRPFPREHNAVGAGLLVDRQPRVP